MMTKRITIIEVKDYVGQEVTIGAWVANKSGKGKIAFLQLRDRTAFFQGVAFKPNFIEKFGEEVGLEKFDTIKRLSQETSVFVTGIVKEDDRRPGGQRFGGGNRNTEFIKFSNHGNLCYDNHSHCTDADRISVCTEIL